jgi:hypothetical protein
MRFLVPVLLLSSTIPSFCQTTEQHSIDPDQIFQMPKQFQLAPRSFSLSPSFKVQLRIMPLPRVVLPSQVPKVGDPHLDSQIIRKPPQDSFAHQQTRTPLAMNIYPDLQLLPVETVRQDATPSK